MRKYVPKVTKLCHTNKYRGLMGRFDYSNLEYSSEILALIETLQHYKTCLPNQQLRLGEIDDSNWIENIILDSRRLKAIVDEEDLPLNESERAVAGYRDVYDLIEECFEYMDLSVNLILQLHKILLSHSPLGGSFKAAANYIGTFTPPSPFETPLLLDALVDEYNRSKAEPLLAIPTFISDFLAIHPFTDGNGRISRLLTLLLLNQAGYHVKLDQKILKTRAEYYSVLSTASYQWHEAKNDQGPFVKYFLTLMVAEFREG